MKGPIAALALTAVALSASVGPAWAGTSVAVSIATPGFGLRIGAPLPGYAPLAGYAPLPAYRPPVPIYVPAPAYFQPPVYLPPVPVVAVQPRVILVPPPAYPVVYPYGAAPVARHWKYGYKGHNHGVVPVGGYAYGRY